MSASKTKLETNFNELKGVLDVKQASQRDVENQIMNIKKSKEEKCRYM